MEIKKGAANATAGDSHGRVVLPQLLRSPSSSLVPVAATAAASVGSPPERPEPKGSHRAPRKRAKTAGGASLRGPQSGVASSREAGAKPRAA